MLTLKILLSLKVIETSVTEVTTIKKFITKKHEQVINKLLEKEEGVNSINRGNKVRLMALYTTCHIVTVILLILKPPPPLNSLQNVESD